MTRILLHYVLPIALPTIVYFGWLWLTRNKRAAAGGPDDARPRTPWFWLIVTGFVLMAGGLIYLGLTDGTRPGTT